MPKKQFTKRKDGRYCTTVTIGYTEDGKPRKKTLYAKTISELEKQIRSLHQKKENGGFDAESITFRDYVESFLEGKEKSSAHETYRMYDQTLNKYGKDMFNRSIGSITRQEIQQIINDNAQRPRTCQKIKIAFNLVFKKAVIDGVISRNPCYALDLPRYASEERRPLTDTEKILIKAADLTEKQRCFLLIAQYYGLRKSEIIALRRESFDWKNNLLIVNHSTEFIHEKPREKDCKNHENRTLKMLPAHAEAIKAYIATVPEDSEPHIFRCEDRSDWMDESSFRRMWAAIIEKLNECATEMDLPKPQGLTCHILRHEFCTNLYYMGIDLREAQKLTGHKTLSVLSEIYVHLDNAKRDPRDKMTAYYEQEEIRQQKALEEAQKKSSQTLKS